MKNVNFIFRLSLGLNFAAISSGAADKPTESQSMSSFSEPAKATQRTSTSVWLDGVGNGFSPEAESIGLNVGAAAGIAAFGGRQHHDFALVSFSYGHMLGLGASDRQPSCGNLEFRAELFTGAQFSPDRNWIVGLTPHLRYNFVTGTRLVPFADAGLGVSATGIGAPDLSGTFAFNLQATVGTHWFFRQDLAIAVEARYLHMSCAGITSPNLGLNAVIGVLGLTWFF